MAAGPARPSATPQPGSGAREQRPIELANKLRPVLLHLNRHLRREVHDLGVTGGQVSLLASIHSHPGIGPGELAGLEGSTAPSMCGHIDRLEGLGLVARLRAADGDRRRVGLSVTTEGERVLRTVRSLRTAWLAAQLEGLTAADRDCIAAALEPLRHLAEQA